MPPHLFPFGNLTGSLVFVSIREGNDQVVDVFWLRSPGDARFGKVVNDGCVRASRLSALRLIGLAIFLPPFRADGQTARFITSSIDRLQSSDCDH